MIWLFDRGGERIKLEICRDENGGGFLLVTTGPDGHERVERVERPTELIERSLDRMSRLRQDGWIVG